MGVTGLETTVLADDGLRSAMRQARVAQAAHEDALRAVTDGKSLRLQVLKGDVEAMLRDVPLQQRVFDPAFQPGFPPKLWLDAATCVVMEPDYRTYRVRQDGPDGVTDLFDSPDRAEIVKYIKILLAHRLVERERRDAKSPGVAPVPEGYSLQALLLAWLAGLASATLVLLAIATYFKYI